MKKSQSAAARFLPYFALALALLFVASYPRARAADDPQMPAVGQMAPDFTLNSQENTPVSLHDFKGKWVVLYFYPKDQTPGCTIEAHGFTRDQDQYTKRNAVILGVSVDSVDSHKEFCAKDGINFKLLSDTSTEVVAKYGSLNQMNGTSRAADDQQMPAVGQMAPDFTLNSQENIPVSLHDFKGKWVVLYFYPKDQTPAAPSKPTASRATRISTLKRTR